MSRFQLYIGRAGSGKTTAIHLEIADTSRHPGRRLLIVPDQFTYASERTLLETLGAQGAQEVTVDGFRHLCDSVFRETGKPTGRVLDETARILLMSRAIDTVADRLRVYARHIHDVGFVRKLVRSVGEYKQSGITPEQLEEAARQDLPRTLREKLGELALLYGAYEAFFTDEYADPLDDLDRLAEQIPQSTALADTDVWVDGFRDFTVQELRVLEALMHRARSLTVSLCADSLEDSEEDNGLFSPAVRTANYLRRLAREAGIPEKEPRYFTNPRHTADPALKEAEAQLYRTEHTPYTQPTEAVTLVRCRDLHEECRYVVDSVRRLMREGVRCRDIAVTARSLDDYLGLLDPVMRQAGIPLSIDRRIDVLTEPPMLLATAALRAVTARYDTDDMLALLKTRLVGDFSADDVAAVEEYVSAWRISGAGWLKPWEGNPDGFSAKIDSRRAEMLKRLNAIRETLTTPLIALREALYCVPQPTGRDFSAALYRYLTDVKAGEQLNSLAVALQAAGDPDAGERYGRLWDLLIDQLDRFAEVLGEVKMKPERLSDLFALTTGALDLGLLPQGLDAVQIGSAERMRYTAPRYVFLLGADRGVFPADIVNSGLFNDAECALLQGFDLPIGDTPENLNILERFCAYRAVSAPSDGLFVSYHERAVSGEQMYPSSIVTELTAILPGCRKITAADPSPETFDSAFLRLTDGTASPETAALLRGALAHDPDYARRLDALERAGRPRNPDFEDPAKAVDFFGKTLRFSSSELDDFGKCRFRYFCKTGLNLRPRRAAELGSAEFGVFTHSVLESLLKKYTAEKTIDSISRKQTDEDVKAALDGLVGLCIPAEEMSERLVSQLNRLKKACQLLMWRLVSELKQSAFRPIAFETKIGTDANDIPPLVFDLEDDARVMVTGIIDRVDTFVQDGITYVRVIDYKTGERTFSLQDVADGLDLQMLLYLYTVCEKGIPSFFVKGQEAGVLYLSAQLRKLINDKDENDTDKALKTWRAEGLLLNDESILRAMEAGGEDFYIITRKGRRKQDPLATMEQFRILRQKIEKLLREMGKALRAGRVSTNPREENDCKYCDYAAICRHTAEDAFRAPCEIEPDDLWALWKEEVSDHVE